MRISDWSSDVCSSDLTYIVTEIDRTSPSTAASAFRRLQQLFRWLEDEGEIDRSPIARMQPPTAPQAPVPEIGRASCRERVGQSVLFSVVAATLKIKTLHTSCRQRVVEVLQTKM